MCVFGCMCVCVCVRAFVCVIMNDSESVQGCVLYPVCVRVVGMCVGVPACLWVRASLCITMCAFGPVVVSLCYGV